MQVMPWSVMKILMQRAMSRAGGITTIKISGVYLRLHAQHWIVWAWNFNKHFPSGVDACAASQRQKEPTSDIYFVHQVTQFWRVQLIL